MHPKTLNEVLKADMDTMRNFNQPLLVNDQLGQLYMDLEVEGFGTELVFEEGTTSSESDSGSSNGSWTEIASQVRERTDEKLTFCQIYRDMLLIFSVFGRITFVLEDGKKLKEG